MIEYLNSPPAFVLQKSVQKYAANLQKKSHAEVWFQ